MGSLSSALPSSPRREASDAALPKDMVEIAIKTGASTRAEVTTAPRFKTGDKVVARNINPPPPVARYIRGNMAW